MNKRLYRAKTRGQSIPLIAAILVALFAMAAVSMDVGNTYAEQRELVRATNGAALEGMDALIRDGNDSAVASRIRASLLANRIPLKPSDASTRERGQVDVTMQYLDASGREILGCKVGSCSGALWDNNKGSIAYIRVETSGDVETTFGRVVGQEALGIGATAFANQGTCVDGIYPIAVPDELLDRTTYRFKEPDRTYTDNIYITPVTVKRIFMREISDTSGNFGFLRWPEDNNYGSQQNLADALTGAGTLKNGFNEAEWPEEITTPAKPDNYPSEPGKLSIGDWVHGATGNKLNGNAVSDALDAHMAVRTILTLPIVDASTGDGSNAAYHIIDMGNFYVLDYGQDHGQPYIDLVYLGKGKRCAGIPGVPPITSLLRLEGQVSLFPHYQQLGETADLPIQFVIVLDISGSMSWNFDGVGVYGGAQVQCQGGTADENGNPPPACDGDGAVSGYPDVTQRRIYIAGQRLTEFVNSLRPNDQVQIVTYSRALAGRSAEQAVEDLTRAYPATGWTSNKSVLSSQIDELTRGPDNNYATIGETPSAVGLARANQIFDGAPAVDPNTGLHYKRAVIFMTDGVANVTRDGEYNDCPQDELDCQSGYMDEAETYPKPVTAMLQEGRLLSSQLTADADTVGNGVYVIALGSENVAASLIDFSPRLYYADTPSGMTSALNTIRAQVLDATCADGGFSRVTPLETVPPGGLPDYAELNHPEVNHAPLMGIVTLTAPGTVRTGYIERDPSSGVMFYRVENIPPGNYSMTYWLAYRSPEDNITRIYDMALPLTGGGTQRRDSQTISLSPLPDTYGAVIRPMVMDLDPTIDVCATTTP